MEDHSNNKGLCHVCRAEMTAIHAEAAPGLHVYVCEKCLETAKQNFIWICMGCGNVYIRPKSLVLNRLADPELKQAYLLCEDRQIIQGIDRCIECDAEGVAEFVSAAKSEKNSGHC